MDKIFFIEIIACKLNFELAPTRFYQKRHAIYTPSV